MQHFVFKVKKGLQISLFKLKVKSAQEETLDVEVG
jgi:hypothetical protein